MSITLPTEDSVPTRDIREKVVLIYGQRKIGKTTFCSQAEGALFLATEPGQSHLKLRRIPITSWSEFLQACALIREGNHPYKTIVIDTIDNLYKFCRDAVLRKNNLQHESDQSFGRGYDLVNGAFHATLTGLSLLPYGLMMISHSQEKEVKTRSGKEIKIAPTLPNSAQKIVNGMADYILYAEVEESKDDDGAITSFRHVLHTKPTTLYEAGMRLEPGQEFPETLPLDYNVFVKALQGECEPAKAEAVTPSQSQSQIETGGKK
jgi:hypothetical protein